MTARIRRRKAEEPGRKSRESRVQAILEDSFRNNSHGRRYRHKKKSYLSTLHTYIHEFLVPCKPEFKFPGACDFRLGRTRTEFSPYYSFLDT